MMARRSVYRARRSSRAGLAVRGGVELGKGEDRWAGGEFVRGSVLGRGPERGGGVLLSLLVLPLYIPVLIFGAGAVDATVSGLGGEGHLSLLAAITFASVGFAPWASAAALKIALE